MKEELLVLSLGNHVGDEKDEHYYLRSLGVDQRKDPASMEKTFPRLWSDFRMPDYVPADKVFSTILRLSSPNVQLWTHYDIMDNVLVQVVGRKEVVLCSPLDVPYLYLQGDKSAVLDVKNPDKERFPLFDKATQYTGILEEGDTLFIPALWFHNTRSLDFSVAVNVFWRHLDDEFYDSKDVYGNRDLIPAQRAQQSFTKTMQQLKSMPSPYKEFYSLRFMEELKTNLL